MGLYITGDVHGEVVKRFSFRQSPNLRKLTKDDVLIVLGDWGVPWNNKTHNEDWYSLKFIDEKPWTTIALRGNHDNTDLMRSMPQEELFGGKVRRAMINPIDGKKGYVADHVFIIDESTILTIGEDRCLCIPGADSHDMAHDASNPFGVAIIDKSKSDWRTLRRKYQSRHKLYRVLGESWWADEAIDIAKTRKLLEDNPGHFDLIFSHDYPGIINSYYKRAGEPGRRISTEGQNFLEELRSSLSFDCWFHGHIHRDSALIPNDDRVFSLYRNIIGV